MAVKVGTRVKHQLSIHLPFDDFASLDRTTCWVFSATSMLLLFFFFSKYGVHAALVDIHTDTDLLLSTSVDVLHEHVVSN